MCQKPSHISQNCLRVSQLAASVATHYVGTTDTELTSVFAGLPPPSSLCHAASATEPICLLLFHSMGPSQGFHLCWLLQRLSELRPPYPRIVTSTRELYPPLLTWHLETWPQFGSNIIKATYNWEWVPIYTLHIAFLSENPHLHLKIPSPHSSLKAVGIGCSENRKR